MIKKILVSQPKPASEKSPYFEIEAKQDVQFTFHPFIKIEGLSSREFRQQKIKILDYTAIVFNSRHAIDYFFTLCKELRVQLPEEMKYFGISETVALYIQKYIPYRKRKVFFGSTGKWADLVTVMAKHKTENYLVPLSDVHSDEVTTMLDAKKLKHKECVMYRTISNDYPANEPFDFDMLVLFTPAGVESLIGMLTANAQEQVLVNPSVDGWAVMVATLILIIIGVLAGAIPAYRAMRIKPIEAMNADK